MCCGDLCTCGGRLAAAERAAGKLVMRINAATLTPLLLYMTF
jgi:hypothetical protein